MKNKPSESKIHMSTNEFQKQLAAAVIVREYESPGTVSEKLLNAAIKRLNR
jgi:hypothetical protein